MNMKINTICFIILLFLLIGVASATDSDNETLQQTIKQPDNDICPVSPDDPEDLKASSESDEKLQASTVSDDKLEASTLNQSMLEKSSSSSKKVLNSLYNCQISMKAPNVKMYYNDGSKFTVTLKDSSKKVIKNVKVTIMINGKSYTKTTNSKGQASLSLNLNPGKYSVITKFKGTKKYDPNFATSTVTIKSTIKSNGLTKYYTNTAAHSATFYDKKGKVLKNTAVKFTLNGKTTSVKTNKKGIAKLAVNLKPGSYTVKQTNPKTTETTSNTILIKTILETKDLTMTEQDGSKFSVKVLNANGKAAAGKKVTLKVNGKTYTPTSNSQGIASQTIDLTPGKYSITTEYEGLKHTNQLTVNRAVIKTPFSHVSLIPDYVNVSAPYAFHDADYVMKTGADGIIKLPKTMVFTVHISETKYYTFSTAPLPETDSIELDHKTYLVPFDGSGVKSDADEANLKGEGILISKIPDNIRIELKSISMMNTELFGVTMNQHRDNVEILTYVQNNLIKARILFFTGEFDELGLRQNLAKLYSKNTYETFFNSYDQLTMNNADKIKFTNTGETVQYDDSRQTILPIISKEYVKTKFIINGVEELEKTESISYGLSESYQPLRGFEVLQSYTIINDKITRDLMERWVSMNSAYLPVMGVKNVYGMFLANIQTAWLADEIANQYAKDLNVKWERQKATAILSGINLDDTYIHILNADMGMSVTGDSQNSKIFRLMNSFYLPNIESHVLKAIADRYQDNVTNSLDNIYESVENNNFSIAQIGEMFYILTENGKNSVIAINSTSGISNVLLIDDDFAYKGSSLATTCDCCSVGTTPLDIMKSIKDDLNKFQKAGGDIVNNILNKIHPLITLLYHAGTFTSSVLAKLAPSAATGFASTIGLILQVHTIGKDAKNTFMEQDDWHWAYKHATFTRDSPLENKKFFNIPRSDGTYDYIEVGINSDGSLNRNDALYVGDGYSKKLTKNETYNYFTEEKWTACNIPRKYQKNEVPLIFG